MPYHILGFIEVKTPIVPLKQLVPIAVLNFGIYLGKVFLFITDNCSEFVHTIFIDIPHQHGNPEYSLGIYTVVLMLVINIYLKSDVEVIIVE